MTFMDRALARRLEATEGTVCMSFAQGRAALEPAHAAAWQDFDGTLATFDGVGSPMTQTFGLGVGSDAPVTAETLAPIEAFFDARGAATQHEVSPLAGVEVYALLVERGYRPVELSTLLVQPLDRPPTLAPLAPGLHVAPLDPARRDAWAAASAAGWGGDEATTAFILGLAAVATASPLRAHYLVARGDAIVATASLAIVGDVALLAGASTVPGARGQGAQRALLATRLAEARDRGCTTAMMVTAPGSSSQRNGERGGFRVAYTRTKWLREAARSG